MRVPRIGSTPAPSQIPKNLGIILLQWNRLYITGYCDRWQRPQETGIGNWNIQGHSIWGCNCRHNKRDYIHKSSVRGTLPKRQPKEDDPKRSWITIGSNKTIYPGGLSTPTASLKLLRFIVNSVFSCHGAKFAFFDAHFFNLAILMDRTEYAKIKISDILSEFID